METRTERKPVRSLLSRAFSMRTAIVILLVLVAACVLGSVIPQGNSLDWYARSYSQRMAGAVMFLGLDDVFHSWWFVTLALVLCADLLGCNLVHMPQLVRRTRLGFDGKRRLASWNGEALGYTADAEAVFFSLGFRKVERGTTQAGQAYCYSVKNRAGIWGAWLCHLGMLVVIIGFGLGQIFQTEYTVYGVGGQTKPVGDTAYELTVEEFTTTLREDETVEQYTSRLSLTDTRTNERQEGTTSVNHPLTLWGMKLYQNSTGWAAMAEISKNGEVIQETLLCAGEYARVDDLPDLVITLAAFYPDLTEDEQGRPATASAAVNRPGYLYRLYYQDQVLGMNVLKEDEVITVEDYTIWFQEPRQYTLIQIKRDPFTKIAALGGLLVLVSLVLAFYLRTAELWAVQVSDGTWAVAGHSRKGGEEFMDAVRARCDRICNGQQDKEGKG